MLRCGPLCYNTKLIKYGAGKPKDFIAAFSCFFIFREHVPTELWRKYNGSSLRPHFYYLTREFYAVYRRLAALNIGGLLSVNPDEIGAWWILKSGKLNGWIASKMLNLSPEFAYALKARMCSSLFQEVFPITVRLD